RLQLQGASPQELLGELIKELKACAQRNDWSAMLSPNCHFLILGSPQVDPNEYISSGPGIEQDTITKLFELYFEQRENEICTPLYEDYTTLLPAASLISDEKREEVTIFGAVTALALIYGYYPGCFNPLLLIYLLNNCNLSCLHAKLVKLYAPSLFATLDHWLHTEPNDAVQEFTAHFSIYHNLPIGALDGRSKAGHQKIAWEMLQYAVIGTESIENDNWQCFKKGFYMQCANAVNVPDIARSFAGGIEDFVQSAQNSVINSFYDLRLRVICCLGTQLSQQLDDAFSEADNDFAGKSFEQIFKEFLTGVGASCPQLLESLKNQFSSEVKLMGIQSSTFRLRLLCWSTTGAP
ncbi:hypothetical protein EV368DRAFT_70310, partial [Lentinula lateritia]